MGLGNLPGVYPVFGIMICYVLLALLVAGSPKIAGARAFQNRIESGNSAGIMYVNKSGFLKRFGHVIAPCADGTVRPVILKALDGNRALRLARALIGLIKIHVVYLAGSLAWGASTNGSRRVA